MVGHGRLLGPVGGVVDELLDLVAERCLGLLGQAALGGELAPRSVIGSRSCQRASSPSARYFAGSVREWPR